MGLIERYGTGVQRIQALYRGSTSQPIFEVSENLIKIVLPLLKGTTKTLTDKMTNNNRSSDKLISDTTQEIDVTTQENRNTTQETTQEIDTTTQENIINILKNNPFATLQEVADMISLSRDGVKYHITKLQERGLIKHEGSTKAGKWIVTEDKYGKINK